MPVIPDVNVVHLVSGEWTDAGVVLTAKCRVKNPKDLYWTINKDAATCQECLKRKK